jgi:mevalonate kinase
MPLKTFPSKILLLGEYTILSGSKALALPYRDFSGHWSYEDTDSEFRMLSQKSLEAFLEYPSQEHIHLDKLAAEIKRGMWFDSSIPQGFGLGSSGALIAAIYQDYARTKGDLLEAKLTLAHLESHFHGSSSGLDPLVSHIQKPLLIHSFEEVEILNQTIDLKGFFLLNTGKPRQTGPLVSIYQEKLKDPQFNQGCANVLSRDVNFAVEALVSGKLENLGHHLWHISKFQWDFFPEMIPTQMRGLWTRGLETGDYILKLCGAGGGGYLLGFSEKYDVEQMNSIIYSHELRTLI